MKSLTIPASDCPGNDDRPVLPPMQITSPVTSATQDGLITPSVGMLLSLRCLSSSIGM
jgi:hypothetical protein